MARHELFTSLVAGGFTQDQALSFMAKMAIEISRYREGQTKEDDGSG